MSDAPANVPWVGVVVLHYNNPRCLSATLDGIRAQSLRAVHTVVVDNASQPSAVEELHTLVQEEQLIELPSNNGYAAGMNAGLVELLEKDPDYVLLLTQEVLLAPDALLHMAKTLGDDAGVGICAPLLILRSAPTRIWSAGGHYTRFTRRPRHAREKELRRSGKAESGLHEALWADGAALLIRSSALRDVGLFYDPFFLYYEEEDFCDRLRRKGWRIVVNGSAAAWQEPSRCGPYLHMRNLVIRARRQEWTRSAAVVRIGVEIVRRVGWSMLREGPSGLGYQFRRIAAGLKDGRTEILRREYLEPRMRP
jgi:GT2 family glycosyltransferase